MLYIHVFSTQIEPFIQIVSENCCIMKIPIQASQNKQRGRMRPAGRQFDMPGWKTLA